MKYANVSATPPASAHVPPRSYYSFAHSEIAKGVEAYDRLVRERPLKPPTRITGGRK